MNRAEKRRQQKIAKKAAKKAQHLPETPPLAGQNTLTIQQAIERGLQHHSAGRLPEAESIYQQILQAEPNQPEAMHLLGLVACQVGKNDIGIELITKALVIKPHYAEAHSNLGNVLQEQGNLDEAVESYHKALAIKPDYTEANYNLGNALKELGKLDEAIASYRKALAIKPDYAEASYNLGLVLQEQGKLDEAVARYHEALATKPDFAEANYNLGIALREQGKLDEAIASYHKTLATKPDFAEANYNLGLVLQEQGKLDEAVESYLKALTIRPDYAEAHSILGNVFQEKGKLDEAVTSYHKALAIKPDYVEANYNLGIALKGQGKLDEAVASFRKALAIKPDYAEAHSNLGNVLYEQGMLDEAIASYHHSLTIKPDYAEAHYNLGLVLKEQGKLDEAVASYHKALAIRPDYAEAHNNLGNAFKEQGMLDEAVASYHKSLAIKPDYPEAQNNLALAFQELGKEDEAIPFFQRSFANRTGIQPIGNVEHSPAMNSLFLELTNKCNFHCKFCPSDSQKRSIGFMDLDLAKRAYGEVAEKQLALKVHLHLMGEPTLHPNLIELLEFGASKNTKTELVTNASTLVAKVVPKILDALDGTLVASHMTPTEDTYHFRGEVGLSWDRYIGNIRLLVREYMKRLANGQNIRNQISLRVMVTQDTASNVSTVETTQEARAILTQWNDFVTEVEQELGMPSFNRQNPQADDLLRGNLHSSTEYPLQQGIVLTFWRAFTFANTRVSDDYDLQPVEETIFCSRPFNDFGVLWNGDVTLCCMDYDGQLNVGNIREASIESVLQCEAANNLRASMLGHYPLSPVCKTCKARTVKHEENPL